jgi:hypothetical protein
VAASPITPIGERLDSGTARNAWLYSYNPLTVPLSQGRASEP